MFELVICAKQGRQVIRRFDLAGLAERGRPLTIGRADECDIRIRDPFVSRRHCQIAVDGGRRWVFRDLNSTHGSYLDDVPVHEAPLEDGLEIVVGPAVLRFESVTARIGREIAAELGDTDVQATAMGHAHGHHDTLPH